jgi:uncharacterized membrane protein YfcA
MDAFGFIVTGWFVGTVIGLTGVGGGSLMTPLLVFGFGIKPYIAIGTDLLFAAFTKASGTWQLTRQGLVPWRVVATLSAGSVPASALTLVFLHRLGPSTAGVQHAMTSGLGLALLLTAGAMLIKAVRGQPSRTPTQTPVASERSRHPALVVALGALIGTLVTLTSVGAGAIGVSALLLLYPQLPMHRVVAADIAYAVPMTLAAGLGHAALGSVDWSLLGLLLCGSLPGIVLGSRLSRQAPERLLRAVLSLLLAWAGSKLMLA